MATKYTKKQLTNFSIEELKCFSDLQLKVLSIEELKSDLKMQRIIEIGKVSENNFWSKEYPRKSREERIMYWLSTTHKGMRTQGEIGQSEYSEFSSKWYERVSSVEPDFDEIFKEVVPKLGFEFDWEEYHKRIQS